MGVLDGIKKAFKMMPELAASVGALVLTVIILGIVAGVFIYQATTNATGGNINIGDENSSAYSLVANQSAEFSSVINVVWDAVTSVTGFIVLGVIALIAVSILGKKFLGGGRV